MLKWLILAATGVPLATAQAQSLDTLLPRGEQTCYGGPQIAHPVLARVRLTRPERLQSYDGRGARMVRIVVNFRNPAGARFEDTATCKRGSAGLVCTSTSCEDVSFRLLGDGGKVKIEMGEATPRAIWSCADAPLNAISLAGQLSTIPVTRAEGACITD